MFADSVSWGAKLDFAFTQGNTYSLWIIFILFVSFALVVDFGTHDMVKKYVRKSNTRDSHRVRSQSLPNEEKKQETKKIIQTESDSSINQKQTFRNALLWTIVWISLAGAFAAILYFALGHDVTLLFVTGYLLEKSLSVDNMFVFLLIFSSLGIPYFRQHKVLMTGILSAIAMRIGLILMGTSLLENFHWMIYIFGALLLFTGIRMLLQRREKNIEIEKNLAVRILRKFIPVTLEANVDKFLLRKNGILLASPLLVALVIVEMTDLIFAMDSIPAILAITTDPLIVITSNVFAILGLPTLYFLLAGMMDRFHYLKVGLATILLFIGIKMLLSELYEIPINTSLVAIFGILAITIIVSVIRTRSDLTKRI